MPVRFNSVMGRILVPLIAATSSEGAWWARQGLNLRPLRCEHSALPLSYAPTPVSKVQPEGCAGVLSRPFRTCPASRNAAAPPPRLAVLQPLTPTESLRTLPALNLGWVDSLICMGS